MADQECSFNSTCGQACGLECRGEWEKVGEVMGSAAGAGGGDTMAVGNRMHAGQQWDFVFDVDVDPNQPPLKLACNRGDNPYAVADR